MNNFLYIISLILALNFCSSAESNRSGDAESDKTSACLTSYQSHGEAFFNDEHKDTRKIQSIIKKVKGIKDINERIIAIAQEFIGTPYVGNTLNIPDNEQLYVNTGALDCTTFVETVISLAKACEYDNPDIDDYLRNLQSIRYHDGKIDGYPSRLHYISEWSIDNGRRGNFSEITAQCPLAVDKVKTVDFMTRNRHLYPALADDTVFEAIKRNEKPLKDLHYSIIPTSQVDKVAKDFLKSGDIVAIETTKTGLDVSHVGVINIKKGVPYLIHASSKYKKVINDTMPLKEYLRKQGSPGIRVFRLPQAS